MTVLAAHDWRTNAHMILEAVVPLDYIKPDDRVIDLTFGRGNWWTQYEHPGGFIGTVESMEALDELASIDPAPWWLHGLRICPDFRDLRAGTGDYTEKFDVAVFDPPYVAMGGRRTSGLPDFMDRYGLENAATTPELLHEDNVRGLGEISKILVPGGLALVKCADYISSGKFKEASGWMRDAAEELGFTIESKLLHLGNAGAQPSYASCRTCSGTGALDGLVCPKCGGAPRTERAQRHPRNNYSVLWIFRWPKRRGKK